MVGANDATLGVLEAIGFEGAFSVTMSSDLITGPRAKDSSFGTLGAILQEFAPLIHIVTPVSIVISFVYVVAPVSIIVSAHNLRCALVHEFKIL